MMLGDFQYFSSSSENSDSEADGEDGADNSDVGLEKLVEAKDEMEKKIQIYEKKLKTVQKSLKQLNEERKRLLDLRNEIIKSQFQENIDQSSNAVLQPVTQELLSTEIHDQESHLQELSNAIIEPLNLDTNQFNIDNENEEEFDSDGSGMD